ncbi:MAG: D-hexose-6-phosphate mutarotase [Spongiibacteraceae bacterium]|nr:D-hexose-6-phosphate mutarotase [Spongiibacteraceae bacterium]
MSITIAQQMQQLYSQFGELEGISIELHKNLLAVRVENSQATATVFLQGAQLSHYQLNNQAPIIWCSESNDYQQGKSLRGGIPICWPWFGDLSRNPDNVKQQIGDIANAPAHGFVREQLWQLDQVEIVNPKLTRLTLSLTLAENTNAYWSYPCALQLTIIIGQQLTLQLQIKNLSQQTFAFSNALHSYFAVGDINQVTINGLESHPYIDCLDQWQSHTQDSALSINQEVDRIYKNTNNTISITDSAWKRVIEIENKGSNSAVVWNPWKDKAKRLSQFDDHDYQNMLCIETANIDDDHVVLPSGKTHQLEVQIRQSSMN